MIDGLAAVTRSSRISVAGNTQPQIVFRGTAENRLLSGCRLPLPRREELSADAQAVYDRLTSTGGENLRGLRGPGGIQLHSPELSQRSRPVNRYLRFEARLGGRVRELAILVT